jgi:hypothetical protein
MGVGRSIGTKRKFSPWPPRGKEGVIMYSYLVYSVNYVEREKTPIGSIFERRNKYRPNNLLGLLKVARKAFAGNPEKAFHVVLEKNVLVGPGSRVRFAP